MLIDIEKYVKYINGLVIMYGHVGILIIKI